MKIIFNSEKEMNKFVKNLDCPSIYGLKDTFEDGDCLKNGCDVCIKSAIKMEVDNSTQSK